MSTCFRSFQDFGCLLARKDLSVGQHAGYYLETHCNSRYSYFFANADASGNFTIGFKRFVSELICWIVTCWCQELAGLLQQSQSAVRQQTLWNRVRLLVMDIKAAELSHENVLKMDRLDRLYVRGGCTLDVDGTKVRSFPKARSFLSIQSLPFFSFPFHTLSPPSQENFRKNWLGLLHLATICGDSLVEAVTKAEQTCAKHGSTLRPTNFRGAEGLIPPDAETFFSR